MELSHTYDYYPKDDGIFVDPLYRPYQKEHISDGTCVRKHYGWEKKYMSPEDFEPEHGKFLRLNPVNPCPVNYVDMGDGWCQRKKVLTSDFYTEDFTKRQKMIGSVTYTGHTKKMVPSPDPVKDGSLRNFSINPHTGNKLEYHQSKPHKNTGRYGGHSSYIGDLYLPL